MDRITLSAFLWRWERYVDNLQRRSLTDQREHLVHSDPGSNRCIAQTGRTNSFLHTLRTQFSYASQLYSESLFSFCYAFCFALSNAHYCVVAHTVAPRDAINTGVRLGEFSGYSAVSLGARPEQNCAGVATLVA